MIEQRWFPFHAVVAFSTAGNLAFGKLLPVNILMAVLTLLRCRLKIDIDQLRFQIGRLMTINAGRGAVRSQ